MRKNWNAIAALMAGTLTFAPLQAEHKATEETQKVEERLTEAKVVFSEIMRADDSSIPEGLLRKAHCVAVVPGVKKAAFLVGAKYGKGFLTCRDSDRRGWSAPANIRIEGGSFGLQIGGGETDVVLLVMNSAGADKLMKSEFKIGGEASAMAGPVGRTVSAETDALMRAEMLSYSRSRGLFAGVALEGSTLREDTDTNRALYGSEYHTVDIVRGGKVTTPAAAKPLIGLLGKYSPIEQK